MDGGTLTEETGDDATTCRSVLRSGRIRDASVERLQRHQGRPDTAPKPANGNTYFYANGDSRLHTHGNLDSGANGDAYGQTRADCHAHTCACTNGNGNAHP